MLSGISINFPKNEDDIHWRYIIRRLMSYGVTSTGDFASDKQLLQKVESGQIPPITETTASKTENYTQNSDYSENSGQNNLEVQRTGAEQLGILMKLRLGLL